MDKKTGSILSAYGYSMWSLCKSAVAPYQKESQIWRKMALNPIKVLWLFFWAILATVVLFLPISISDSFLLRGFKSLMNWQ